MRTGRSFLLIALAAASACFAAQAPGEYRPSPVIPKPTFPHDAKLSLITGHLATARVVAAFACPENDICLDSVWDDTFADMETQLGPKIAPLAHVRSVHDAGLARGPVLAYVVKPADDGQLWAIALRIVERNRACFDSWLADDWPEFAAHSRTMRSGDQVCFRLN